MMTKPKTTKRPIVFVVHSLGGLVLKSVSRSGSYVRGMLADHGNRHWFMRVWLAKPIFPTIDMLSSRLMGSYFLGHLTWVSTTFRWPKLCYTYDPSSSMPMTRSSRISLRNATQLKLSCRYLYRSAAGIIQNSSTNNSGLPSLEGCQRWYVHFSCEAHSLTWLRSSLKKTLQSFQELSMLRLWVCIKTMQDWLSSNRKTTETSKSFHITYCRWPNEPSPRTVRDGIFIVS